MSFCIPTFITSEMKRPVSVRRCLFERPTAEKQEKDFETQESRLFEQEAKAFSEKWGLDPKTGSFVSGAEYECIPVDLSQESIPSFYTKGYASRKPRPAQSLRRERSQFGLSVVATRLNFDCPRPMKRKRLSEDGENYCDRDENREVIRHENIVRNERVPVDGEVITDVSESSCPTISSASSSVSTSTTFSSARDVSNSPISISFSLLNAKMKDSRSMPNISPRSTDLCTPQQRPRSLTQKTMKDFLPCKKPRCVAKILPRT